MRRWRQERRGQKPRAEPLGTLSRPAPARPKVYLSLLERPPHHHLGQPGKAAGLGADELPFASSRGGGDDQVVGTARRAAAAGVLFATSTRARIPHLAAISGSRESDLPSLTEEITR